MSNRQLLYRVFLGVILANLLLFVSEAVIVLALESLLFGVYERHNPWLGLATFAANALSQVAVVLLLWWAAKLATTDHAPSILRKNSQLLAFGAAAAASMLLLLTYKSLANEATSELYVRLLRMDMPIAVIATVLHIAVPIALIWMILASLSKKLTGDAV